MTDGTKEISMDVNWGCRSESEMEIPTEQQREKSSMMVEGSMMA